MAGGCCWFKALPFQPLRPQACCRLAWRDHKWDPNPENSAANIMCPGFSAVLRWFDLDGDAPGPQVLSVLFSPALHQEVAQPRDVLCRQGRPGPPAFSLRVKTLLTRAVQ